MEIRRIVHPSIYPFSFINEHMFFTVLKQRLVDAAVWDFLAKTFKDWKASKEYLYSTFFSPNVSEGRPH